MADKDKTSNNSHLSAFDSSCSNEAYYNGRGDDVIKASFP